jgi:hypothetical protein
LPVVSMTNLPDLTGPDDCILYRTWNWCASCDGSAWLSPCAGPWVGLLFCLNSRRSQRMQRESVCVSMQMNKFKPWNSIQAHTALEIYSFRRLIPHESYPIVLNRYLDHRCLKWISQEA